MFVLGDNGSDKLNKFTYIGIRTKMRELQQITDKVFDKRITNLIQSIYISKIVRPEERTSR